ncbi:MAG: isopenicillin N synthase family oxygenase [Proteobacteria bacterium]|nr:isopenicillin N synthase family oxygenase [Pseudomonadota bacterium]
MSRAVPELSLRLYSKGNAAARRQFCDSVAAGLHDYGFIVLADHGVDASLLDRAYRQSEALFALDTAAKNRYRSGLRGYTPFGTEHAKHSNHADLKEFWQIGRERAGLVHDVELEPNIWPAELPKFQPLYKSLYAALDATAQLILRALAPSLALPDDYFASLTRRGNSILRLIHYPPLLPNADPAALRSAPHEDINFLTVLVAARGPGLQILDRDGGWLPVDTAPRNLIVNSGDMLARLTNDKIAATTHRVVNPAGPNVSRYSMPFFLHPTDSTSLACLPACVGTGAKYPPITAGEFLAQRIREIGLAPAVADATEKG